MHRFFIPSEWIKQDGVVITDRLAHQLKSVLRLGRGDSVIVLDNSGWEYEVELEKVDRVSALGIIKSRKPSQGEVVMQVTLYQALLKSNKFELVLQKGTELGVKRFVPLICERCTNREIANIDHHRLSRWQRIIQEAAEQSGRGRLPLLSYPVFFKEACDSTSGLSFLAWEKEKARGLKTVLQSCIKEDKIERPLSINIFIGPEGGLTLEEVEFARSRGILSISLGNRLLRSETAGLVVTAAILYEYNELGDERTW